MADSICVTARNGVSIKADLVQMALVRLVLDYCITLIRVKFVVHVTNFGVSWVQANCDRPPRAAPCLGRSAQGIACPSLRCLEPERSDERGRPRCRRTGTYGARSCPVGFVAVGKSLPYNPLAPRNGHR